MLKKIFLSCACLALVFTALSVPFTDLQAQDSIIDPNSAQYQEGNYSLDDIMITIISISGWILGIIGSLALLMFVYGGFMFLISAGSSDKVGQAKKIIVAAVIGLVIVFSSYLIIRFVSQAMGDDLEGGRIITNSSQQH